MQIASKAAKLQEHRDPAARWGEVPIQGQQNVANWEKKEMRERSRK